MFPSKFYTSLAVCLLSLSPIIQAETSQPEALPSPVAERNEEASSRSLGVKSSVNAKVKVSVDMNSPLLMNEFYPRWTQMDIEEAPALMRALITQAERQISEISQVKPADMSYENTFGAMAKPDDKLSRCYMAFIQLSSISDSTELRKVREELTILISAYQSRIANNEALWKNLNIAATGDWVVTLSPAKKRFIQNCLNYFKDSIEKLKPEQKKRKQEILEELGKLELKFEKNIKDATSACSLIIKDPAELAGMDLSWRASAAKKARDKGHGFDYFFFKSSQWLITMNDYSHWNILNYCEHEATRRACWEAYTQIATQAPYNNEPIVHRIAELRQELAQLLGFDNFASYTMKHSMIGSEPNMRRFLKGMIAQLKPAFERENNELLAFISEKKGKKLTKIAPWDQYYYLNLLEEERYPLDKDQLCVTFDLEKVTQGMFFTFEQLFNIRFEEKESYCPDKEEKMPSDTAELWDSEVRVFEVFDASSNKHLGSFYLDLFYREQKRAGAWAIHIRPGISGIDGRPHLATLTCDFGDMLSHDEVLILFHEMGHILHFILSKTELRSQEGGNVVMDFIEFPSQLAELWAWTPQVLELIASIPDKEMKQLLRSQHFMPAMAGMKQLSLALIDLELHSQYDKLFKGKSLDEASHIILKDMCLPLSQDEPSPLQRFTHCLSSRYASNYYSYKWGKVLAADAFSRFLKDGVLNPNAGKHLRESILSKGDSAPAMELFKNFMGREPNIDALLELQGILHAKEEK